MRILILFIACCWLTALAQPTTPLTVATTYRVTEVKPSENVFGIALMTDNPNETQNDVYPEDHTILTKKVRFSNGMVKEFPLTRERFFQLLSKGDVVQVEGHRNFDMSIEADKIWLMEK